MIGVGGLRGARCWLAALVLMGCIGPARAALELRPHVQGLNAAQAAASRDLLASALRRLPPRWRERARIVEVQWRDDLPAGVHGRAYDEVILLDSALLVAWMARRGTGGTHSDPATRAALSAVVHELAHVHDRSEGGALSRSPRLLDLAGWQRHPTRLGLRLASNRFRERSPDRYELESPAEYVAVNLEHFLLDPGYACRRPAMHAWLAQHFDWSPPGEECAPGQVFVQAGLHEDAKPWVAIDPARIHAVDYLLAEPDGRVASRWGHSMLRLVVCAPGRLPGPDCRLDLEHHQVLSFRAFVDDLQLSTWRGLTGAYPSRLFVLPLRQVVEEYTRVELRGLRSIPLQLQAGEIEALLERAAQLHWSYDGRYYFVSNNCAVETWKLLHDSMPRLAALPLASVTPTGLLRRLGDAGVADVAVLEDPAHALRLGYRFDAMSERYQAVFRVARDSLGLPHSRLEQWLALPPQARARWTGEADLRGSAALLVLEQAALRRQEQLASDELKRLLARQARRRDSVFPGETGADRLAAIEAYLHLEASLGRPAALLPDAGYGLPQADERTALAAQADRVESLWRADGARLRAGALELLGTERRAGLLDSQANLDALQARLRVLHAEEGGLLLP